MKGLYASEVVFCSAFFGVPTVAAAVAGHLLGGVMAGDVGAIAGTAVGVVASVVPLVMIGLRIAGRGGDNG